LLALENLQLKNEELLIEEQEFNELKAEEDIVKKEGELERQEEFDQFIANAVGVDLETKKQASIEFSNLKKIEQEKVLANVKENNKRLAGMYRANQDAAVGFAQAAGDAIIALNGDSATAGLILQKSFAIAEVFIADSRARAAATVAAANTTAATAAFNPIGAVAAGAAVKASMDGAITAATGLALGTIAAQTVSQVARAARGGFMPDTNGGSRDRINLQAEPGELIVPKAIAPDFIQSVGNPASGDFANDDVTTPTESEKIIRLEGDLVQNDEFVTALASKLQEQQEFDNVRI